MKRIIQLRTNQQNIETQLVSYQQKLIQGVKE